MRRQAQPAFGILTLFYLRRQSLRLPVKQCAKSCGNRRFFS